MDDLIEVVFHCRMVHSTFVVTSECGAQSEHRNLGDEELDRGIHDQLPIWTYLIPEHSQLDDLGITNAKRNHLNFWLLSFDLHITQLKRATCKQQWISGRYEQNRTSNGLDGGMSSIFRGDILDHKQCKGIGADGLVVNDERQHDASNNSQW